MARVYSEGPAPPLDARDGAHWFDTEAMLWRRLASGHGWREIADLNASRVKWADAELDVLRNHFEREGAEGCAKRLNGRIANGIKQRARKLGLKDPTDIRGSFTNLGGERLEEAIRLRDDKGWSFKRIGLFFGVCETAATNAYFIAMCPRRGFRPAERDRNGRLLPAEIERLRAMLRKGLKGWEIQLRMGVSAAFVAQQRRRHQPPLKGHPKGPLPPPGGGERYSGARIGRDEKRRAEFLYLAGHGTPRVSKETGISHTHCLRIRSKLIRRLARKGQTLPGCDRKGVRHAQVHSRKQVSAAQREQRRALLMQGVGLKRGGLMAGVGGCSAYRIRNELKQDLGARGEQLPPTKRVGRGGAIAARWLPTGARWIYLYRILIDEHGADEARRIIVSGIACIGEIAIELRRAVGFESDAGGGAHLERAPNAPAPSPAHHETPIAH